MFVNKYPYTDLHELNLDWILKNVKRIADENGVIMQDLEHLQQEYQKLDDFYNATLT